MSDPQQSNGLGKRKRQLDTEEGPIYSNIHPNTSLQVSPTTNKRRLHSLGHGSPETSNRTYRLPTTLQTYIKPEGRPFKQTKRTSPKIGFVKIPSYLMDVEPEASSSTSHITPAPPPTSNSDLRPCHICHSAPKRKKDLESYLQCQKCEERACYICARECSGGCQKQLCSKCCVEVGEEGDAWCLDCYQRVNTVIRV